MALENVQLDDVPSDPMPDRSFAPDGVAAQLRDLAQASGIDATNELYNRAGQLANDYQFAKADSELALLLALDPADGQAHLLRAKVQAGLLRWTEARASLLQARELGVHAPPELTARIEEKASADHAASSERTAAFQAREEGEITALRQEARRLRSENAHLVGRVHDLSGEVRRWAWITSGVAGVAIVFIAANLLLGGPGDPAPATPVASEPAAEAPAAAPGDTAPAAATATAAAAAQGDATTAPSAPPPASALAQQAQQALNEAAGLDGSQLKVAVQSGKLVVSGTVETALQRRRADEVLSSVPGVAAVDTAKVKILARTRGAKHVVVSGDNLTRIARDYYGDASLAPKIMGANPKTLGGKPDLRVGMELKLPAVD